MVGKTARIRDIDRRRFDVIREHCGCVCCLLVFAQYVIPTIEHATSRGRRIGGKEQHQNTIGLCVWHHFGTPAAGFSAEQMVEAFGPSLAKGRTPFEEFFGPEEALIEVVDSVVDAFDTDPWGPYNVPAGVVIIAQQRWRLLVPTAAQAVPRG